MVNEKRCLMFFILWLVTAGSVFGQGRPYEGPDDPASDIAAVREGWMNGNRVLTYFKNTGLIAEWPNFDLSKWPNDHTGTGMIDNLRLLICARVYLEPGTNNPVDDPLEIQRRADLDTLYYCQTSHTECFSDENPEGTLNWVFYPVFGYFNVNSEYPAMSNLPDSWPPTGWPSRGNELKWPGEWDGRFGRNIIYAGLESYFVFNDAHDQEYLGEDDIVKYYPRPGVYIGDKLPDVTIQKGCPWGGIGIRVKARGYQWNNPESRDAIFWEFDIANISDYNLTDVAFGFYMDNGIGHVGSTSDEDDIAFFDAYEDISYSWDVNGVGVGGNRTGINAIAFLESPGIYDNGVDNDDDGLLDESRDNHAKQIIGPTDGIQDLNKFLSWYGYDSADQLVEHWDADEDQDWDDGIDANGNGTYARYDSIAGVWRLEEGEYAGDDVGLDGVGPTSLDYRGPDVDGSECNHKPDFLEGYGCEPDFGATDISESDMLGLTSFAMFLHPSCDNIPQVKHDKEAYFQIAEPKLIEWSGDQGNLYQSFGSGVFALNRGLTERVSVAEMHSYESLSGLNSSEHSAPAMFQKKKIVQSIYESDYRFVQEPEMPTLKATPGDGQVTLTWDDRAEKYTQEPLLRNANDFEGYKLYRATDKFFSDAEVLRDVYGNPAGKYPIYQCDLIDGIKGIFDASHLNGLNYYLGDDTGITNYYIDKEVENGRTYYYGLAAYDYGIDAEEIAVLPSENTVVFKLDENENIMPDIDQNPNVKAVTPYPPAAGYVSPFVDKEEDTQLFGNSEVTPQIFDDSEIKGGHSYKVVFDVDTLGNIAMSARFSRPDGLVKCNSGFSVYDMTEGGRLAYREDADNFNGDNISVEDEVYVGVRLATDVKYMNNTKEILTGVFDGIQLRMNLKARYGEYAPELSGWIVGDAPINITPSERQAAGYPHRYEIVFTNEDSAYVGKTDQDRRITNAEMAGGDFLLQHPFDFYIVNKMLMDSTGNPEICDLVVEDMDANGEFDKLVDRILVGYPFPQGDKIYWSGTVFVIDFLQAGDESNLPKPGDVYLVDFYRPFAEDDTISFKVDSGTDVDRQLLEQGLSEIKVVPNPYVATNTMEPALSNYLFNQRRRLMFTHIPARCTIKIFTSSGVFVDEIDVANSPENGIVHWDMLTSEGLEIAAGLYIYHIRAHTTGDEKVGKFAVIK